MKYIRVDIPITEYYFMPAFIWKKKRYFKKATGSKGDACFFWGVHNQDYPLIGELHFVKGLIGVGMAAHELTHAALRFSAVMDKEENEEFLCETARVMTRRFWNAIRENKKSNKWIYKDK